MTGNGLGVQSQRPRYYAAARNCEELADKITRGETDALYKLQGMVEAAWQGGAGPSLDRALVDKAGLVSGAAGILRAAAVKLRRAAMDVQ